MIKEEQLSQIESVVSTHVQNAKEELEQEGHVIPRFILISQDEESGDLCVAEIFAPAYAQVSAGSTARRHIAEMIRGMATDCKAIAYVNIMEIWIKKGTTESPPTRGGYANLGDDPEREEAVSVLLETSVGSRMSIMPIIRRAGLPPTFNPRSPWDTVALGGDVVGMIGRQA